MAGASFVAPQLLMYPLADRLQVCRELADLMDDVMGGQMREQAGVPGRRLILAHWARASGTFSAVLLLAQDGYGDQVGMLARSLFESTVDAFWTAAHPR
jgi:hypothetical protein